MRGRAIVVRGAVGFGNPVAGVLTFWPPGSNGRCRHLPPGAILVVPGTISFAFLHQVLASGISGVIASSIAARDLEGFLRSDLIQLLDCDDTEMAAGASSTSYFVFNRGSGHVCMPSHVLTRSVQLPSRQSCLAFRSDLGTSGIFPELVISLYHKQLLYNYSLFALMSAMFSKFIHIYLKLSTCFNLIMWITFCVFLDFHVSNCSITKQVKRSIKRLTRRKFVISGLLQLK